MKNLKLLFVALIVLSFSSCNSSNELEFSTLLGIYVGTVNSNTSNKSSSSVPNTDYFAEVKTKGNQLEVHCYGEDLDIKFMLDYFENNDSYMVCLTGQDYKNLYGHLHGKGMMSGNNMNNIHSEDTEWMQHLSTMHNPDDDHFNGEFDMNNRSFNCTFSWQGNRVIFNGIKQ